MGMEGIVSKRRDAPYRSGRTERWVKAKCKLRRAFPIIAFVEKLGASRARKGRCDAEPSEMRVPPSRARSSRRLQFLGDPHPDPAGDQDA